MTEPTLVGHTPRLFVLISRQDENDGLTTLVPEGDTVYTSIKKAKKAANGLADKRDDVQYIVHLEPGHCCFYAERTRSTYYRDFKWDDWSQVESSAACPILGEP